MQSSKLLEMTGAQIEDWLIEDPEAEAIYGHGRDYLVEMLRVRRVAIKRGVEIPTGYRELADKLTGNVPFAEIQRYCAAQAKMEI